MQKDRVSEWVLTWLDDNTLLVAFGAGFVLLLALLVIGVLIGGLMDWPWLQPWALAHNPFPAMFAWLPLMLVSHIFLRTWFDRRRRLKGLPPRDL
jgi:hypothetical protein